MKQICRENPEERVWGKFKTFGERQRMCSDPLALILAGANRMYVRTVRVLHTIRQHVQYDLVNVIPPS